MENLKNQFLEGNPFQKNKMILFLSIISLVLSLPYYLSPFAIEIFEDNSYLLDYFNFTHPFFYSWFQIIGHLLILIAIIYIIFSKTYINSKKVKYLAVSLLFINLIYQYYNSNMYISNYFDLNSSFLPVTVLIKSIIESVNVMYFFTLGISMFSLGIIFLMSILIIVYLLLNLFHGEERFKVKNYMILASKTLSLSLFILFVSFSIFYGNKFISSSKSIYSYSYTFDGHTFDSQFWCPKIKKEDKVRFIYGGIGEIYKFSSPIKNKEVSISLTGINYINPQKYLPTLTIIKCRKEP